VTGERDSRVKFGVMWTREVNETKQLEMNSKRQNRWQQREK
jgi:hypothetical protein